MCECVKVTSEYQYRDQDGNPVYKDVARSCEIDLDLHRYQCTQCGEIDYYSSAAQRYYENGEKNSILGLN